MNMHGGMGIPDEAGSGALATAWDFFESLYLLPYVEAWEVK